MCVLRLRTSVLHSLPSESQIQHSLGLNTPSVSEEVIKCHFHLDLSLVAHQQWCLTSQQRAVLQYLGPCFLMLKVMLGAANDMESSSMESGVVLPGESLFVFHLFNCGLLRIGEARGANDQA